MSSLTVRPWEVREGDRIMGTSMVATGPAKYAGYVFADATDQQRYLLEVRHGDGDLRTIPYADTSQVNVIRADSDV